MQQKKKIAVDCYINIIIYKWLSKLSHRWLNVGLKILDIFIIFFLCQSKF